MFKFLFFMIALLTLLLNVFLIYSLTRDKKYSQKSHSWKKEIVSFDLTQYAVNEEAAATEVLETEVMVSRINQE